MRRLKSALSLLLVRPARVDAALRMRRFAAGVFVLAAAFAASPAWAKTAAPPAPYAAKEMIRSTRDLTIAPGASAEFTIGFKNAGGSAWTADGKNFVSVYTYAPKYRKTPFSDESWISDVQPARLTEAKVAPGQIGRVSFTLFAPLQEGTYHETFQLAAESLAWIPGGQFTVDITVKKGASASVSTSSGAAPKFAPGYKALKMLVSDRSVSLDAGATKQFRVGFKNIGRTAWTKNGSAPLALKAASGAPMAFRDASWSNDVVTTLPEQEIKPGQLVFMTFTISAPRSGGVFTPKFVLTAGGDLVEGGEVEIPVEVRQGQAPSSVDAPHDQQYARSGARGPNIRIGLYATASPIVVASDGAYDLVENDTDKIRSLSGVTTVTFDPSTLTYLVRNGSFSYAANVHVSLVPQDPASGIFEIRSLENRPTWDRTINFNTFRGTLEIHYVRATGRLWVIDELPVEDYLRGLGETSNGSPYEFQKALVTAARTYALFVMALGGKHQSEYFDLDTSGNDQVYKGYESELVRPNVVRAVEETRGKVIEYGGDMVVTPYFSQSDGRTRSWTEVWSSTPHPWLVSKPAPHDRGKTMLGHGVGMSANDAVGRANEGSSWTDILKYYYTGIDIVPLY